MKSLFLRGYYLSCIDLSQETCMDLKYSQNVTKLLAAQSKNKVYKGFEIKDKDGKFQIFDKKYNSQRGEVSTMEEAKKKIDQYFEKNASAKIEAANVSAKPPKKWFAKMEKEIKKKNPEYSAKQVDKTIGDIWYNKLTDAKRKEIRGREGKTYRAASSYPMLARVLAESDDRRSNPVDDQIWEVQPIKWKKAKEGQPLNFPMNPKAKSPSEKMDGMPRTKK